jgi:RND family efflux transporter MFP subunit
LKKLIGTIFLSAIIFWGCGNSDENQNSQNGGGWDSGGYGGQRTTSVETEPVTIGTISDQVRSYGNIKAQDVVVITPQVSNRITEIYVDLGDTVKQGEMLAKIYDATYRDQLNQARSQVEQSLIALKRDSANFERQKRLLEKDLVSDAEYDNAEATYQNSLAQYQSAKASLTQAQETFNNTQIRSPVNGVIISRNFEEGDIATTGQGLFEIASDTGYETRVYLPVQDWRAVKVGQPVKLRVSNEESMSSTKGVVSRKSPQLDAITGLGEVVITLTQIGPSIYPGVLTESVIDIETKPEAIIVQRSSLVEKVETVIEPESNTIQLERTYSVFVSKGDSIAELRQLELGIEQGDKIEVLAGLQPDDKVIVTGQNSLQDGSKIRVASQSVFQSASENANSINNQQADGSSQANRPGAQALQNLSDEERAKVRQRMKNMDPEERRALIDSIRTANTSGN